MITQAQDILHGRVARVITRITQLTAEHPPSTASTRRTSARVQGYPTAKHPYLDYPRALAAGWPSPPASSKAPAAPGQ